MYLLMLKRECEPTHDLLQLCVAAVAEGLGLRRFAAAEIGGAGCFRRPGEGREAGFLMRAIAEWLLMR